jgi:hypothetical protein
VESIILGGRKADYFRQVKRELEAQGEAVGRSSLKLAKQAKRVHAPAPATALDQAADTLQVLLGELKRLSLDDAAAHDLKRALETFQSFGADRWLSATAQLLVAANALGAASPTRPPRQSGASKKRRRTPAKAARKKAPKARNMRKQASKRKA